jgi:hypothetical protein
LWGEEEGVAGLGSFAGLSAPRLGVFPFHALVEWAFAEPPTLGTPETLHKGFREGRHEVEITWYVFPADISRCEAQSVGGARLKSPRMESRRAGRLGTTSSGERGVSMRSVSPLGSLEAENLLNVFTLVAACPTSVTRQQQTQHVVVETWRMVGRGEQGLAGFDSRCQKRAPRVSKQRPKLPSH